MAIAPETQARLLEQLARFEIEAFERARSIADPRSLEVARADLRREEVLQDTLRQALWLGDRDVARAPLRHVASCLGISLDESEPDWMALAYEATKVLLDISCERSRRQQGIYDGATPFFRRAVAASGQTDSAHVAGLHQISRTAPVEPASFASMATEVATPDTADATQLAETMSAATQPAPPCEVGLKMVVAKPVAASTKPMTAPHPATPMGQIIIPAGLGMPEGYDEAGWQQARIAARPPRILIDRKLLSEGSRAAIEKQRGITLVEAIELYFELLSLGYRAPFNRHQKRKPSRVKSADATTEDRLSGDHRSKRRLALDYWPAALGDEPVDEIHVDDVNDALELMWRLPANHSKSDKDRGKYNLVEFIERADAMQTRVEKSIEAAEARGEPAETIDRMRLKGHKARIAVATYLKHGRVMRAVGEILMDMQLIDQDPFSICTWSNDDEDALRTEEGDRKRQAWDDRIGNLWCSPIFQEPLKDVGEPLFWAPLIARHMGLRMEEVLQLGPDDFGSDKGIPYLTVRHTIINGLKTLSSARELPIHPQLVELGLLKLVELRRKEGRVRLFPFLTRGKTKGTLSANFSKSFGYYRRTNECYWPGLDFHALQTTFHHDLLADEKSDAIRCRLMGHTYTDEGDRSYGQNLSIETLAERMASVVVDISMIRRPFAAQKGDGTVRAKTPGLRLVG